MSPELVGRRHVKTWISNKLPGDNDAATPSTTLGEPLLYLVPFSLRFLSQRTLSHSTCRISGIDMENSGALGNVYLSNSGAERKYEISIAVVY